VFEKERLVTRLPDHLPNKPLIEAILEVRWGQEGQPDAAYPLIVGRLYERLKTQYPAIEDLPIVQVPPEITVHQVRHRFRAAKDGWPLVQVGPGVLTVNETEGYRWRDFSERAKTLLPLLHETHPKPENLQITSLLLRYVNAIDFDYASSDVLAFLAEKMRVSLSFVPSTREKGIVRGNPKSLGIHVIFPAQTPTGSVILLVGTGKRKGADAIVWEIHFRSVAGEIPTLPDAFPSWLESAHDTVEKWFIEMVQGKLLAQFSKP
jgi:uncharacterized protein (TIGR04255 family)